jgi:hypothetical protein
MIPIEKIFTPRITSADIADNIGKAIVRFADEYCPAACQFITPARQLWYDPDFIDDDHLPDALVFHIKPAFDDDVYMLSLRDKGNMMPLLVCDDPVTAGLLALCCVVQKHNHFPVIYYDSVKIDYRVMMRGYFCGRAAFWSTIIDRKESIFTDENCKKNNLFSYQYGKRSLFLTAMQLADRLSAMMQFPPKAVAGAAVIENVIRDRRYDRITLKDAQSCAYWYLRIRETMPDFTMEDTYISARCFKAIMGYPVCRCPDCN